MSNNIPFQSGADNNIRLDTIIRVRWLAVAGQTVAVLFVAFALDFQLQTPVCVALIACSAWLNVFLGFYFRTNTRLTANWALALLGYDILQLSALLFVTGGLQNPFSLLLVVPVVVSATTQSLQRTIILAILAIVCATVLIFLRWELPWFTGEHLELPLVYVLGVWVAIVSCIMFTAAYAYRVADEARKLSNALAATELVLQREQHLSALDGLAAAAAHELGTPLATISLVSKEMLRELPKDSEYYEDAQLLKSQADRCREILQKLSVLSEEGDLHIGKLKLSSMLEEIASPHRFLGIDVELDITPSQQEPLLIRNPGILYGLGNLVENAVDFARKKVVLSANWDKDTIKIIVADDGEGFSPDVLAHIGDPFITTRPNNHQNHAGGLGLGLFIAKTLLERSGAVIEFKNSDSGDLSGANITIFWPRSAIDANDKLASEGELDKLEFGAIGGDLSHVDQSGFDK